MLGWKSLMAGFILNARWDTCRQALGGTVTIPVEFPISRNIRMCARIRVWLPSYRSACATFPFYLYLYNGF